MGDQQLDRDVRDGYWSTKWLKCVHCESYAPLGGRNVPEGERATKKNSIPIDNVTCGPNCPTWLAGIQPGAEWGYEEVEIVQRWYYKGKQITEAEYVAANMTAIASGIDYC